MTQTDVERMNTHRYRLESELKSVTAKKEAADQDTWSIEMAVSKKIEELEQNVDMYNRVLADNISAYCPDGNKLEVELRAHDAKAVLSINMDKLARPSIEHLREQVIQQVTSSLCIT